MEPIHLFRPHFRVEECLEEIRECLESGWTGLGYKTLEIESAWRSYTELPFAHFLNSATAGLHLAVRLLRQADGWEDDDEVITTPLTFVSTNHVIVHEHLKPVFADVDETLCLDPDRIADQITPRTRAVVYVGLGGNTGRLGEVADLCRDRGLRLILDAAHMAGTRIDGNHIGAEADVAVFSFQAVKNLPTSDAGMVCFADGGLDDAARKASWLGISSDTYTRTKSGREGYRWMYDVPEVGFKYHGNSVSAAMALVALKYLDADNAERRRIAGLYDGLLAEAPWVERVPISPGCDPSRHLYQVLVDNRDEVMVGLNNAGIYPGVHYRSNIDYPMYSYAQGKCPVAEEASSRLISLPLHLGLSDDDVRRVCAELVRLTSPHA